MRGTLLLLFALVAHGGSVFGDNVESQADAMARAIESESKLVEAQSDAMVGAINAKARTVDSAEAEQKFERASQKTENVMDSAEQAVEDKASKAEEKQNRAEDKMEALSKKVERIANTDSSNSTTARDSRPVILGSGKTSGQAIHDNAHSRVTISYQTHLKQHETDNDCEDATDINLDGPLSNDCEDKGFDGASDELAPEEGNAFDKPGEEYESKRSIESSAKPRLTISYHVPAPREKSVGEMIKGTDGDDPMDYTTPKHKGDVELKEKNVDFVFSSNEEPGDTEFMDHTAEHPGVSLFEKQHGDESVDVSDKPFSDDIKHVDDEANKEDDSADLNKEQKHTSKHKKKDKAVTHKHEESDKGEQQDNMDESDYKAGELASTLMHLFGRKHAKHVATDKQTSHEEEHSKEKSVNINLMFGNSAPSEHQHDNAHDKEQADRQGKPQFSGQDKSSEQHKNSTTLKIKLVVSPEMGSKAGQQSPAPYMERQDDEQKQSVKVDTDKTLKIKLHINPETGEIVRHHHRHHHHKEEAEEQGPTGKVSSEMMSKPGRKKFPMMLFPIKDFLRPGNVNPSMQPFAFNPRPTPSMMAPNPSGSSFLADAPHQISDRKTPMQSTDYGIANNVFIAPSKIGRPNLKVMNELEEDTILRKLAKQTSREQAFQDLATKLMSHQINSKLAQLKPNDIPDPKWQYWPSLFDKNIGQVAGSQQMSVLPEGAVDLMQTEFPEYAQREAQVEKTPEEISVFGVKKTQVARKIENVGRQMLGKIGKEGNAKVKKIGKNIAKKKWDKANLGTENKEKEKVRQDWGKARVGNNDRDLHGKRHGLRETGNSKKNMDKNSSVDKRGKAQVNKKKAADKSKALEEWGKASVGKQARVSRKKEADKSKALEEWGEAKLGKKGRRNRNRDALGKKRRG
ncbi:uncharacterized protein LOC116620041 isoform X2 [Nematostella vectensis]|uniref:uncharacterized protein LOC116620041 isoform X2 n=1 Tax=Nematostella vectensis TaxID=45351 RepID=UPI00207732B1|nr:uncharacterized protein LOC116620041 isoform X2 [Nematostella vectensis]